MADILKNALACQPKGITDQLYIIDTMGGIPYEKRLHIVRDFRTRTPPTRRGGYYPEREGRG